MCSAEEAEALRRDGSDADTTSPPTRDGRCDVVKAKAPTPPRQAAATIRNFMVEYE